MATLKQLLKKKLTKKQLALTPSSFDIVGDIAVFSEFPKELRSKEKVIANALMKLNKNIKTVAKKTEKHSGRYRLKKVKIIAGKKTKETIHKENNIKLKLNIETCYFSPRLSGERLRIARLIKPNEKVLVMFSGVAPYPILISKISLAKEVYGIEINPQAHKYAQENLKLNKVTNVILYKGDVRKVLPKLKKKFDRIVMPLPKTAHTFLDLTIKYLNKNGTIHFYDFSNEEEFPNSSINKIKKYCKPRILKKIKCGKYAPGIYRVCMDFKL